MVCELAETENAETKPAAVEIEPVSKSTPPLLRAHLLVRVSDHLNKASGLCTILFLIIFVIQTLWKGSTDMFEIEGYAYHRI